MDVGIRELKQRLSEYLRRVEAGEVIRVTDRGIPKAVISPVDGPDQLQRGIDEGWIRPAVQPGPLGRGRRAPSQRRTKNVLREDRGA